MGHLMGRAGQAGKQADERSWQLDSRSSSGEYEELEAIF